MPSELDFVLKSHPGRIRPLNEDAIGADPRVGLFVLADGLGGYNAGEVASTMAVSTLLAGLSTKLVEANEEARAFDPGGELRHALIGMNNAIFRAALNSSAYEGMATTVVVAWFLAGRLWVAHAGDSRLYLLRQNALTQVTRDHSFSQELLDAGMVTEEEARLLPAKNLVTRALGAAAEVEPEVHDYPIEAGDVFLLCSDGLTEMVTQPEIGGMLTHCGNDIRDAARRLIDLANEAGGRDNTSVILVRVGADATRPAPDLSEHEQHNNGHGPTTIERLVDAPAFASIDDALSQGHGGGQLGK
jgi:PPM family protein phosphatase